VSSDSFFILNVAGGDDSDLRSECRGVLYSNMCYVESNRFRIPMCWCQCRCPLFATVRSSSVIFVSLEWHEVDRLTFGPVVCTLSR
jgi:hypothetical protein